RFIASNWDWAAAMSAKVSGWLSGTQIPARECEPAGQPAAELPGPDTANTPATLTARTATSVARILLIKRLLEELAADSDDPRASSVPERRWRAARYSRDASTYRATSGNAEFTGPKP